MEAKPTSAPVHQPPDLSGPSLTITEHAPLPMATVEGASHIVRYVNPAFCRLMDKPAEQLVGKTFAEMMPEKDECLTLLDRVYRTGKSERHTEQQHSKPHPVFWSYAMWPVLAGERPVGVMIQVTETALFHGQMVAMNEALMLGSVRQHELTEASDKLNVLLRLEITERKLAKEALRASEERYRTLFESIDEGFCIIEKVEGEAGEPLDFSYVEANPAFVAQSGLSGVVGKTIRQMVPGESEADEWLFTYDTVRRTGEPIRFERVLVAQQRMLELYAFRVEDETHRRVAVIFKDITERKKGEEALRQSEERFRALFDRGPIAMYSCDSSGAIQEFNACAVELWGREPKRGDTDDQFGGPLKLYLPDGTFMPREQTPMAKVLDGEIPAAQDMEIVIERPDGSRITVIANIVPLKNGRGEITGAINCFYDITERSRLERKTQEQAEALADLHRRKDEFLAMLSHELRNPLAPISNAVHLLRLQKNEDPLQQQARNIIERQVGQLKHLVDDLLEVSRITTGRVQLRQERIVVSGIVERAVETANPLISQHRHELTVSLPPQPIWLHADAGRLEQVVVNLLTNAAKYTDEGGHIWLTVHQEGATAVLRVRDTGIGIAPELLPRIFDLFTQAERSLDRSQGGLGIGLSLVQRLVELHGGAVEASSVLGQGSEFVVRLPVMLTSMPASPSPSAETALTPGKCCGVLVVDDNVDAAQSLAKLLQASGHDVRMAYDGPSALEAALNYRPDVVLLDIGLPGLNGFEVAKRIRQQPTLKNIVLVAMTGYGQEADRQRSQEAGFDHHLVKPADFDTVQKILATVPDRMGNSSAQP